MTRRTFGPGSAGLILGLTLLATGPARALVHRGEPFCGPAGGAPRAHHPAPVGAGCRVCLVGASEPAYAVHGTGAVLHAVSRAQGLRASFAASGVTVAAGSSPLGIGLRAIGNARWMPAPASSGGTGDEEPGRLREPGRQRVVCQRPARRRTGLHRREPVGRGRGRPPDSVAGVVGQPGTHADRGRPRTGLSTRRQADHGLPGPGGQRCSWPVAARLAGIAKRWRARPGRRSWRAVPRADRSGDPVGHGAHSRP